MVKKEGDMKTAIKWRSQKGGGGGDEQQLRKLGRKSSHRTARARREKVIPRRRHQPKAE